MEHLLQKSMYSYLMKLMWFFRWVWRYTVCSSEPPALWLAPPQMSCPVPPDQLCVTTWAGGEEHEIRIYFLTNIKNYLIESAVSSYESMY